MGPLPDFLVLFHLLPLISLPTLTPSLQTELSLQKEQLQLKIIEIEDEAEKWHKEKDRIKVSVPQTSLLLYSYLTCSAWKEADLLFKASDTYLYPTLLSFGITHPLWLDYQFSF